LFSGLCSKSIRLVEHFCFFLTFRIKNDCEFVSSILLHIFSFPSLQAATNPETCRGNVQLTKDLCSFKARSPEKILRGSASQTGGLCQGQEAGVGVSADG
jgi:hypothetical protein